MFFLWPLARRADARGKSPAAALPLRGLGVLRALHTGAWVTCKISSAEYNLEIPSPKNLQRKQRSECPLVLGTVQIAWLLQKREKRLGTKQTYRKK